MRRRYGEFGPRSVDGTEVQAAQRRSISLVRSRTYEKCTLKISDVSICRYTPISPSSEKKAAARLELA